MPTDRNTNVHSDNFDIEEYETEGNDDAYKLQYNDSKRTRMTEAIEEIKDVKSYAYDNFKLLKISQIMNMIILGFLFLLMILISVTVNNTGGGGEPWTATADCEAGWVGDEGWLVDGESLNMGCLKFETSTMEWNVAKQFCEVSGSRLVEIYTRPQHAFLKEKLRALDSSSTTFFWTGASDEISEGQIRWVSSGRELRNEMNGFEWQYGRFSQNQNSNNDYVALTRSSDEMIAFTGFLTTSSQKYHPICQIPP